jgi:hypothetical protein
MTIAAYGETRATPRRFRERLPEALAVRRFPGSGQFKISLHQLSLEGEESLLKMGSLLRKLFCLNIFVEVVVDKGHWRWSC